MPRQIYGATHYAAEEEATFMCPGKREGKKKSRRK